MYINYPVLNDSINQVEEGASNNSDTLKTFETWRIEVFQPEYFIT